MHSCLGTYALYIGRKDLTFRVLEIDSACHIGVRGPPQRIDREEPFDLLKPLFTVLLQVRCQLHRYSGVPRANCCLLFLLISAHS